MPKKLLYNAFQSINNSKCIPLNIKSKLNKLHNNLIKLFNHIGHYYFLVTCRQFNVFPDFIKNMFCNVLLFSKNTSRNSTLARKIRSLCKELLVIQIEEISQKINNLSRVCNFLYDELHVFVNLGGSKMCLNILTRLISNDLDALTLENYHRHKNK